MPIGKSRAKIKLVILPAATLGIVKEWQLSLAKRTIEKAQTNAQQVYLAS
jgi:hypothetical protein